MKTNWGGQREISVSNISGQFPSYGLSYIWPLSIQCGGLCLNGFCSLVRLNSSLLCLKEVEMSWCISSSWKLHKLNRDVKCKYASLYFKQETHCACTFCCLIPNIYMLNNSLFNDTILSLWYKSADVTFQDYCLWSICNNRRMKNVNMSMGFTQGKHALSTQDCFKQWGKIMGCLPFEEHI